MSLSTTYLFTVDGSVSLKNSNNILVDLRRITDRTGLAPTSYVDIKSKELQEVLVKVLADVRGVSLREDKPSVRFCQSSKASLLIWQTG